MSQGNEPAPSRSPQSVPEAMGFLAEAGKQMLESSSSVSEVLVRLRAFAPAIGLDGCAIDANLTSLTVSYWHHGLDQPLTLMKEINIASPRLGRLAGADALLTEVEQGRVGFDEAYTRVRALGDAPIKKPGLRNIALLVSVAGWVVFVGGDDLPTVIVALLATLLTIPTSAFARRLSLPPVTGTFVAAVVLAAVPNLVAALGASISVGPAVVGALFVYLPGLALVSAVVDGLANAPISAVSRGLQALVTAGALAVGMLVGSTIGAGLGLKFTPNATEAPLVITLAGAALGMLGLAIVWSQSRRQMAPTVIIGVLGWLAVWVAAQRAWGPDWVGTLIAAAVIGIAGTVAAALQSSSATVYTGVAILPLVPGLALYRAMLAVAEGRTAVATEQLLIAAAISLAIAVGIGLGLALGRQGRGVGRRLKGVAGTPGAA